MREAAGYIVFHRDGDDRRFLTIRNREHGTWGFPKGHLEPGETPRDAARRELLEETGIAEFEEVPGFEDRVEYVVRKRGAGGGERTGPKIVHWFLARVANEAFELSDEHDRGGWMKAAEVLATLQHDNSRELFERALRRLQHPGAAG